MLNLDLSDVLVILGAILLALAVGLAVGWVGVLGYAGALALVIGVAMARRGADEKPTR